MSVKTAQTHSITLAQALRRPTNLLTPVRLLMALGVLVGHSYVVILGDAAPEPLRVFSITISYAAVNGFFILSGLLITRSFDRNPDIIRFISARLLRLFPALIVLSLASVLLFGPVFTLLTPAAYFTDASLWRYLCDVLTFGSTAGGPPQVFPNNPWPGEFSATLWTLRYEAIAYGGKPSPWAFWALPFAHSHFGDLCAFSCGFYGGANCARGSAGSVYGPDASVDGLSFGCRTLCLAAFTTH